MCISLGIIDQAGSWLTLPGDIKLQGKEKARTYLIENPKVYNSLQKTLKEMMGV